MGGTPIIGLFFSDRLHAGQAFLELLPDHLVHAAEQAYQPGDEGARAVHGLRHLRGIALALQREFDRIVGLKGLDEVDLDHHVC